VRGRPFAAVVADLVEGVVVVNALTGPAADRVRARLWDAAGSADTHGRADPARVA
jgi:hypothetical protein